MAAQIILQPSEVWDYYLKHKNELTSTVFEIASNDEYGVTVYLSESNNKLGTILVEADDVTVYKEVIVSRDDACKTVLKIYDEYLSSEFINDEVSQCEKQDVENTDYHSEDVILAREEELNEAVGVFIDCVCPGIFDAGITDDRIEDIKDHFLDYLYLKHGIEPYRPMILEDENGITSYEDYPYDSLEIEDSENPIYQS